MLITLFFGLKPFNFHSSNDVEHHADQGFLRFNSSAAERNPFNQSGLTYPSDPIAIPSDGSLGIAFEVKYRAKPDGLGVICCIFDEQDRELLVIAQWQTHLAIRSRREPSRTKQGRGYSEIGLRDCFSNEQFTQFSIESDRQGTRITIDGVERSYSKNFSLVEASDGHPYSCVFGSDPYGLQGWRGDLNSIRIFDPTNKSIPIFEYTAAAPKQTLNNHLIIPKSFQPPKISWLASFDHDTIRDPKRRTDIYVNVIGFIPLGFSFLLLARQTTTIHGRSMLAILAACLFSLLIESLQIFLPYRDSSLLDLACNSLGALLALPALRLYKRATRSSL